MKRDSKGRFIKGHNETQEESLKRISAMKEAWRKRKDYIADIVNECPKLYNMWRSFRFTKKGKLYGNSEEWNDYKNFYNDVRNLYFEGCFMRRKDTTKPFSKDNIMFLSKEQLSGLKCKTFLEYEGKIMSLYELANEYNQPYSAIKNRYYNKAKRKYTTEEIIFGRIKKRNDKRPKDISEVDSIRTKASKMISSYKHKDKICGNDVCDIDIDWMVENIMTKPCVYCGDTKRIGCDRIDNNIGHIKSNVVPCCYECNCARNNNFSHEEMIEIGKVIREIKSRRK